MTLRVGIVGFGVVGKKRFAWFEANPHTQVVAVADQIFSKDKPDFSINSYANYDALVENEDIDILVVCLTNDIAPEVTIKGLQRGLHVFAKNHQGAMLLILKRCVRLRLLARALKLNMGSIIAIMTV